MANDHPPAGKPVSKDARPEGASAAHAQCEECGAPLPYNGTCRENLNALLAIEWDIPGGPGELAHFLAVAAFGVQHPALMGYTQDTLDGLVSAVRDVTQADATIQDIRRRVRYAVRQAGRVTRRGDDPTPVHVVQTWPIVITDVIAQGTSNYGANVAEWARSVIESIEG